MVNWTTVIVAAIGAIPASIAAYASVLTRRAVRTPSGDSLGTVVERTHDLAAVATLANTRDFVQSEPSMERSKQRLNEDERSPVKVNGESTR